MRKVPIRGNRKRKVEYDRIRELWASGSWTKSSLARHLNISVSLVRAVINQTGFYKTAEQRQREEALKNFKEQRKRGSGLIVAW